ncbi:sulfotransferase domain-containing protein [Vitiosangium sp. GDMCC 1.1324]|uniref:sulfotransferase domain-containing protein n=1 Tax=Vitiosangium sp. (strain GDMCC 1.1324) TaxID=2138576 RepID=UPI00130D892B|nr:sulfotransferase domain-containing protein [Vitiosangium sp. GDMCC 1.1324]
MHRRLLDSGITLLGMLASLVWGVMGPIHTLSMRLRWKRFRMYQFKARPDDVFIVTYPKSGTTWMQMIVWQLKSGGSLDFRHIEDVVPFLDRCGAADLPRLEALESPRFFKSHLPYEDVPRGGRYIYVVRNLKDVAVSYYHHYLLMEDFKGGLNVFVKMLVTRRTNGGSWARHVLSWLEHRNDPNVLFLSYDEMQADLPGTLRRVARFSGLTLDEALMPLLVEQCGVAFMKRLEARFDPRLSRRGNFVRKGETGDGLRELDAKLQADVLCEEQRVFDRARELDASGALERLLRGEVLSSHDASKEATHEKLRKLPS